MKILVCNVGSTSLKFKLYDMPEGSVLAQRAVPEKLKYRRLVRLEEVEA